ncbi:hypothetical protein HPB49_020765 [Dermacentor silvarum]|uniref:Uncharacterized protein n=1 Tax=Dermacentor silvarum TaxID=543639 RepID=A0ACB8CZX5_DERSI|nr:hypothetical protein HPB49_020765 [Dermacentor silvarum]
MGQNNTGRRKARAEALGRRLSSKPAIYVDAAQESAHTFTIAAVNNEGQRVSSRTISAGSIYEAEEAPIALGIAASRYSFIISDFMSAIRSYMQGSVGPRASEILREPAGKVTIIWMPPLSRNDGNEITHRAARELINRVVEACPRPLPGGTTPSHSYNEIVTAYREDRRIYPPLDSSLSITHATHLRRAQTCTVMSPKFYLIYPKATIIQNVNAATQIQLISIILSSPKKSPAASSLTGGVGLRTKIY